jgi:hypothetical protein
MNELTLGQGTRSRYLDDIIHLNDPEVQLIVRSGDAYDNSFNVGGATPLASGDIDNDGFPDLIMGSPYGDGMLENRGNSGQVMVFFGGTQTPSNTLVDQADRIPGEIDLIIHGMDYSDILGFSVASGDIDGDNHDDLIIGVPFGDSRDNNRQDAGEVYILWGQSRNDWEPELDLRSTPPNVMIQGARRGDRAGYSVAVDDVIGDSREDIIIGCPTADPEGRSNSGMVFIVAGASRTTLGSTIDLSQSRSASRSARGTASVKMIGVTPDDRSGFALATGDINGDDRADILIGARHAQYNGSRNNAGVTYVIYGKQTLPSKINFTMEADAYIYGANGGDNSGWALAAGDFNGDSFDDIIIGNPYADGPNNGQRDSGEVYIIYGSNSFPSSLDIAFDEYDIIVYADNAWDNFGYSVNLGNQNGDKYADLLIGSRRGDGEYNDVGDSGETFLILGNTSSSFGTTIDPLSGSRTILYGIDVGDHAGMNVQFCDFDNDLLEDIIISAPYADGPQNARDSCGEFFVVYSDAPPLNNQFLKLVDGDINNQTIFAQYKPYTFRVNVTNILGYSDLDSITLTIDPDGLEISYIWYRLSNEFRLVNDPLDLVECVSISADSSHDGFLNYSVDFKLIFSWNFSSEQTIDCRVATKGILSYPDVDYYYDVFKVNNKLNLIGDLKITGALQGKIEPNGWVKGSEQITFSGLKVVYNDTTNFYPPPDVYSLAVQDNTDLWIVKTPNLGQSITAKVITPDSSTEYFYNFKIIGLPTGGDVSNVKVTLKIDNLVPPAPLEIRCKADSFTEVGSALVDDDTELYIVWDKSVDTGAGVKGYYYSFQDLGGTNKGIWTTSTSTKINNATEGVNTLYVWSEDKVGNIGTAIGCEVFVDLSEVVFVNFTPAQDHWITSREVLCSIQVWDNDGFGVDPGSITYHDMQTKKWLPVDLENDSYLNNTLDLAGTYINVSVLAELNEGLDSFIQFRASDLAGNGPTESPKYYFKIDTTPVIFFDATPNSTEKQAQPQIRCYISVNDLDGSGVNLETIQYSYSTSGATNFTEWSKNGLALVANNSQSGSSATGTTTWFVDLAFTRGGENLIRWRAKDLAGNGYTITENYTVLVNSLPVIVIDGLEPGRVYDTLTDIELNAEGTYDPDSTLLDKNFRWTSNISGNLGEGKVIITRLPPGRHLITLTVSDDFGSVGQHFNVTVQPPATSRTEDDSGMFGLSKDADGVIISLIVLIIIIVILFLLMFSRELRKRKRLEEKALGMGEYSRFPPQGASGALKPGMVSKGIPTLAGVDTSGGDVEGHPFSVTPKPKIQQLPGVGGTNGQPTPTVVVPGSGPPSVGRQLPQLPPARIGGYPFNQRKPDLKIEIDTRKKIELLEKKMLVGEIPVELYSKLSKKYDEELKRQSKPDKEQDQSGKDKDEPSQKSAERSNDKSIPEDTSKSPIPKPGVTPSIKPIHIPTVQAGITPEQQAKEQETERESEQSKDQVGKKKKKKKIKNPKEDPALDPEVTKLEVEESETESQYKKVKSKQDTGAGFESAPGFSSEDLEFLKNLRKDTESKSKKDKTEDEK